MKENFKKKKKNEKVMEKKNDKLYVNWKSYINSFNSQINITDILQIYVI